MHERESRERRTRWHHQRAQRLFSKARLEIVERDCVLHAEVSNSRPPQLSQMCADGQTSAKIFGQRSHVRARRTDHARAEVEGPVQIIFEQLTVRFDGSELVNANTHRFTVHRLALAREFVKLPALALFRRIHRRHLVYPTTQTGKRLFDLLFVPIPELRGLWTINWCTSAIAGVGGVAQPDDGVVLL